MDQIRQSVPGANVLFRALDLASLDTIEAFADELRSSCDSLELLINNAGVMMPPKRRQTEDGFELQFGTNYLGHFALTARLLPLLRKGDKPRVVSLSSIAARNGTISFEDLQAQQNYKPMPVYSQSKLACLMFALELQRRSDAAGWGIQSVVAHPGISRTELLPNGTGAWSAPALACRFLWFLFQPSSQGALPTLFAATSAQAQGGVYYGPDKFGEIRGYPTVATVPPQALDISAAKRLWDESERLTGVTFPFIDQARGADK
ncbi:short-chain dehydrogenase [Alcanivorax sp. PN-3]|nr:short-chain dehydrogenase [Alcanivorax sp. PN-3]